MCKLFDCFNDHEVTSLFALNETAHQFSDELLTKRKELPVCSKEKDD